MHGSGLGIVFLPFVLVLEMVYLFYGIRYKKSKKIKGRVIDSKGSEIVYYGGRLWDEIYETYDVRYFYKNQMFEDEVRTNVTGLKPGYPIDVYVYDLDGRHEVQTDIYWRKFKMFAGYSAFLIVVVIMASFMIWGIYKSNENDRLRYTHYNYYNSEEYEQIKKQTEEFLHEEYGLDTDNLNY